MMQECIDKWGLEDKKFRREFINWAYTEAFLSKKYSAFLPENLVREIITLELNQWINEEPTNPIPYRWTLNLISIEKAIILNPNDELTLYVYGRILSSGIIINQHDIDRYGHYSGDPIMDIKNIKFFLSFIENILDEDKKTRLNVLMESLLNKAIIFIKNQSKIDWI